MKKRLIAAAMIIFASCAKEPYKPKASDDYNSMDLFRHGLCSVCIGDKWGYIDKTGKYEYLKKKLKSVNRLDKILKDLIQNREDNFCDRKQLKEEEEKINKTIGDLSGLWLKK